MKWLIAFMAFLFCATATAQTSTIETFGQNRVQYKSFTFSYYQSDNFVTYFYQGGQDIAKYVIKTAEDDADEISKMLDFRYKKKIDIIIYNSINELNQTNIGIYEPNQTPGGTIKIPEGKIFIYFNGDHRNLEKQIREGIAKIYIDKMVLGTGFAEFVQNAVLLNLPDWYKLGMIEYIGEDWNSDMEDHLRDGILSGRYKQLNKLKPDEAVFVGHSIWHYIEETHGKAAVNNIFYLTRINRSVDDGFMFVLGTSLTETLKDWYTYYFNRFTNETKTAALPDNSAVIKTRMRKNLQYYQPKISPDGKYVAYSSNDMGRYKVHLLNTETGKRKIILRGGFRTNTIFTDQSIPLIAWDPSGKRVAIINDKRSNIRLTFYDIEKKKTEINPVRKFQKVVGFNFIDSKQLVMSAMQNGQTDIFLYTIASTTTRKITDDYFDDLYPAYITVDSMRGIMFSSNRTDDTLKPQRYESQIMNKQLDLFFYDLDANSNVLYRVTSTSLANETYPQNYNDSAFCFLSDANGVRNRYIGHFETVFDHNQKTYRFITKETDELDSVAVNESVPLDSALDRGAVQLKDSSLEKVFKTSGVTANYTNYTHSILEQSATPQGQALDLFKIKNRYQLRKYDMRATAITGNAPVMGYMLQLQNGNMALDSIRRRKEEKTQRPVAPKIDSINANRGKRPFDFQSDFDYGIKLFDWDSVAALKINQDENGYMFRFSRVRPYFVRFMIDNVAVQADNNPIITRYQPFNPANPAYVINSLGFMLKAGITDLLEDYKIYGGFRFPFEGISGNSEYFITYENLKKRLDQKYTFYRSSQTSSALTGLLPFSNTMIPASEINGINYSIKTNYLEAQLKYPLDVLNSFRFIFSFRNDNVVYKSQDTFSLHQPNAADNWLAVRSEYVFDNSMEVMANIRYGARFKVFAEVQKEFPTQNQLLSGQWEVPLPSFNNRVLGIVGFDLRYYLKIYRQIIWANRISGAASFGNARMIYYLGGLDNWLTSPSFNKFDYTTPIDYNNNYAFQTLATPLRGFVQNARNGDKYLLINSELRIPVFAALIKSTIKSDFIKNMELIAFADIGSAWEGLSPYSNTNPLFTHQLVNDPLNPSVIVNLKEYKTPILFGFGPGIRTTFLGYFVKFDMAWGYDTGVISQKPKYYLSLGYDF